ncbi:hypothetical protein MNEG_11703, partial [Monoraphidium neglectum]
CENRHAPAPGSPAFKQPAFDAFGPTTEPGHPLGARSRLANTPCTAAAPPAQAPQAQAAAQAQAVDQQQQQQQQQQQSSSSSSGGRSGGLLRFGPGARMRLGPQR